MTAEAARTAALAALRARLDRLEGAGRQAAGVWPTGLAPLDAALPGGGLRRGALHEIVAAPGDAAAALGFAATLLTGPARHGPVLWCAAEAGLYGPGLAGLGLPPERLILVRAPRPADRLWAMEEGLRCPGLGAVLGEAAALDLTASRRLQLAAEASGVIALALCGEAAGATAAVTRWRVAAAPSGAPLAADQRDFGLVRARWRVELTRCRGAAPAAGEAGHGAWWVEEGDAAGAFALARDLADRPAETARRRSG